MPLAFTQEDFLFPNEDGFVLFAAGFAVPWGFDMNSSSSTVFRKRHSENELFCSLLGKDHVYTFPTAQFTCKKNKIYKYDLDLIMEDSFQKTKTLTPIHVTSCGMSFKPRLYLPSNLTVFVSGTFGLLNGHV